MYFDHDAVKKMGEAFKRDRDSDIDGFVRTAKSLVVSEQVTGRGYREQGRHLHDASERLWLSLQAWLGASEMYGKRLEECGNEMRSTDRSFKGDLGAVQSRVEK